MNKTKIFMKKKVKEVKTWTSNKSMKALLRYLRMKNERPKPSRDRANED